LPDYSCYNAPKWEKYTKQLENIPKWPYNIPAYSIARPSKIYPRFENIPSGKPALGASS
jgi:hypothetical protein